MSGFEVNGVQYGATNSPKRIIELNQGETIDSVVYGKGFSYIFWWKSTKKPCILFVLKWLLPFESSCIWFGVRIVSNVKFITSEGRQLGDAPFNSYGWCKNDGQDGSLKYEGPYEQDLDWSRLDEQLVYVMGSDKKQYISAFKPIPGTFKCYLSPFFSKIWSDVNSWATSYCLLIQWVYSEFF